MECARRRAARSLRVFCSFVPSSFAEMTSRAAARRAPSRAERRAERRAPCRAHRRRRDRDYVVKTLARKLIMKSKGVKSIGRSDIDIIPNKLT